MVQFLPVRDGLRIPLHGLSCLKICAPHTQPLAPKTRHSSVGTSRAVCGGGGWNRSDASSTTRPWLCRSPACVSLLRDSFTDRNGKLHCCCAVRGSRPGKIVALSEQEIRSICTKSREIFLNQPILLELEAPLKICGQSRIDCTTGPARPMETAAYGAGALRWALASRLLGKPLLLAAMVWSSLSMRPALHANVCRLNGCRCR